MEFILRWMKEVNYGHLNSWHLIAWCDVNLVFENSAFFAS